MTAEFDPYHKWLGIPPKLQPPNHYRLLGVELFESDLDVIEAAANQRMAYLQGLASGEHGELSQTLLNELAAARVCLMDPDDKKAYDAKLKQQIEASKKEKKQATAESRELLTDADPAPPPVAAAPPVVVPEPDPMPPATRVPAAARPAARASVAAQTAASKVPAGQAARPNKPPPVRAKSPPANVAPPVSMPPGRPTSRARQLRRKRGHPLLVAAGSTVAVLVLLAVIYVASGQRNGGQTPRGSVPQGAPRTAPRPLGRRTAEPPDAKTNVDGHASDGGSARSAGPTRPQEELNDEFLTTGPVGDFAPAKPKPTGGSLSPEEIPFTEAKAAITNGNFEQVRPLLDRVLQSPDGGQRAWARQMLEEVDIATSDDAAAELLDRQLSDEQLERLVKGEAEVTVEGFQFSYPALRDRFQQTIKKNARLALERRRADRAKTMVPTSDHPAADAATRAEEAPAKPKGSPAAAASDPAQLLASRGLRKRGEYWLLESNDELRESVEQVDGLTRSSRAADTALLKAVDAYREVANQVAMAERTGRIGIVEEAHRQLDNAKREYREVVAKSMKARNALAIASLRAARETEKLRGEYRELADDPDVQRALEQLGPGANRLGPTPTLERNLERIQRNDERLLTDQVMGFFGGEEDNVFHVDVIVNDRTSALFALRPQAEFSLIPEQVLREAGIPYDAARKLERKADGVSFRTSRVVVPSLRLGRFVSTNIEAFVLPSEVHKLSGFLANNAFPNFRIEVKPGESVAKLRPTR